MEIIARINEQRIDQYAKRKTATTMKIATLIFALISLFFFITTKFSGLSFVILIVFSFLTLIIFAISFNGARSMAKRIEIILNDNGVIYYHLKDESDRFTNLSMEISEMKYGTKFSKVFSFSIIECTEITEKDIIITSSDFSFLDDNNKIVIPYEINNYSLIVEEIKKNPLKYKLI